MKHVLMLGYFFPPSKAAGTFRTLRFTRDLAKFGWRPDVLTVNAGTYPSNDQDLQLLHQVPNEVRIIRTPAPPMHRWFKQAIQGLRYLLVGQPEKPTVASSISTPKATTTPAEDSGPKRLPRPGSFTEWIYTCLRTPDIDAAWYLFGLVRGLRWVAKLKPCVIYATGGPWTTFLIARDLSFLTRTPLVLDYRDPWVFNPAVKRGGGFFEHLAAILERSVVRQATCIVANTDVLRETLIEAHGESIADKTVVINNSYNEQDFQGQGPTREKIFTISYVGSLYDAHSPEPFLRALKILLEQKTELRGTFRVKLVGAGAPRTTQMVLAMGLDDVVEVRSAVPHSDALNVERASHALLLFLTVPSDNSTFIPSKLFEYIAAQRPIFAVTRGGALQRILEMRQLTPWIYTPEDLQGMADGIADLVDCHERGCLPELSLETIQSFAGSAATASLAAVLDAAGKVRAGKGTLGESPAVRELTPAGTEPK